MPKKRTCSGDGVSICSCIKKHLKGQHICHIGNHQASNALREIACNHLGVLKECISLVILRDDDNLIPMDKDVPHGAPRIRNLDLTKLCSSAWQACGKVNEDEEEFQETDFCFAIPVCSYG